MLAAVAVVAVHVGFKTGASFHSTVPSHMLARFDTGVPVFFVISGILLGRPWIDSYLSGRRSPARGKYLQRRVLRIMPLYWLVLLITILTLDMDSRRRPFDRFLEVIDAQQYGVNAIPRGLESTWSLTVEGTFYLVLPLAAMLLFQARTGDPRSVGARARRSLAWLALTVPVSVAWVAIASDHARLLRTGDWLPGNIDWFAAGLAIAVISVWSEHDERVRARFTAVTSSAIGLWILAAALLLLQGTSVAGPAGTLPLPTASESVMRNLLSLGIATCLVLPAAVPNPVPWLRFLFVNRVSRHLADLSYGVFLWHLPLLTLFYQLTDRPTFTGNFWTTFLLILAGSLVLSELSFQLLERPILTRRRRIPATGQHQAAAARQGD